MSRKRESYVQFTQQFLEQLDARHRYSSSLDHEQHELRIRMAQFRLLSQQQMQRDHQQWPSITDRNGAVDLLREYKQQALDIEKTKERYNALACCIQRKYRAYIAAKRRLYSSTIHWTLELLIRIKIYALRIKTRVVRRRRRRHASQTTIANCPAPKGEVELRSVSIAVSISLPMLEALTFGKSDPTVVHQRQPTNLRIQALPLPAINQDYAIRQLPPYELVVQLLSARDIFRVLPAVSSVSFEADIRVLALSKHEVSKWPTRAVFASIVNEMIHWQDETLSVAVDPAETKPASVIDDWTIHLHLQAHYEEDGLMGTKPLGRIIVPLSLLESPLSISYELCRWFPLEKSAPGEITRGEVRLRVRYLMRAMEDQAEIMIPYKPRAEVKALGNRTEVPRKIPAKKRSALVRPSGLQRRRSSDLGVHPNQASVSHAKTTERQERRIANPVGPRPRAEVLSPPSSPSSVSSEAPSPISPHRDSGRRRSSFRRSPSQKLNENSLEQEEHERDAPPANAGPARAFLKRKPYKVVFRKLDWSKIAAKTDSKWNIQQISTPSLSNFNNSLPSKPSVSIPRQPQLAEETVHATTERLKLLSEAMYACCHVSSQTAAIAQLKYQSERKSYVRPPTSSPRGLADDANKEPSSPPSALSSHAAMGALFRQLTHDSTGEIYASLLESLSVASPK